MQFSREIFIMTLIFGEKFKAIIEKIFQGFYYPYHHHTWKQIPGNGMQIRSDKTVCILLLNRRSKIYWSN